MKSLVASGRSPASLKVGLPALVLLTLSCTSQPVILPSRDFDRPSDLTFVCMGTFEPGGASDAVDGGTDANEGTEAGAPAGAGLVASGRPMRECHPRGTVDVADAVHHTFAFLPNSSSGNLSVLDADKWSLVNLDPANAGFNTLPLGVLPSQIAASDDGCRLVTANHGSCDLSVVDPAALLAPTLARDAKAGITAAGSTIVTNVVPRTKNSGRELRVLAGEVTFLPMGTAALTKGQNLCSGDPNHQWQALATFPSCDLVALIDLPSGVIQQAAYARKTASGVALVPLADGEDPVCPVDCGYPPAAGSADASPPDAGAAAPELEAGAPETGAPEAGATEAGTPEAGPSGGALEAGASDVGTAEAGASEAGAAEAGAPEAGTDAQAAPPPVVPGAMPYVGPGALRPGPIAIVPESGRAFVGLANAAFVLAFNVDQNQLTVPAGGGAIPLAEGALGVDRVRLSIDPYQDKTAGGDGKSGTFVGDDPAAGLGDRQYLYVVARDGSLRVVQVAHVPETECETNLDFTTIADPTASSQAMTAACLPVAGPAARRPGSIGPGIRLPTPPIDVAVADIRPDPPDNSETSVSGAHAWVLTASGTVYLVNINPVPRSIFWVDDKDPNLGAVHECLTPEGDCHPEPAPPPNTLRNRGFVGFTLALDPSTGPARLDVPPAQSSIGPRIDSIWTRGTANNATALSADYLKTYVLFPDQTPVTAQTWALSWEGNLLPSPRATGQLQSDAAGTSLVDVGMDFCRLGVQERDLVTLEGCTNTSQCGIGKECILGSNGAEGAGGLPITGLCMTPTLPRAECDDLLSTVKRYDVTLAHQTVLGIEPHRDELVRPALKPCTGNSAAPADGGVDAGDGADARAPDASVDAKDASADAGDAGMPKVDDCPDPADPSTADFRCNLEEHRCLYPCSKPGETAGCRAGRICLSYGADATSCADGKCFCADGPRIGGPNASTKANAADCLGELFSYQVGVGRGFAVSGSQAALPATEMADANAACVPIPNLDPRVRIRIPMDAPRCAEPIEDNMLDSRCDPNPNLTNPGCPTASTAADAMTTAGKLLAILDTQNNPNPCMFNGGPNDSDPLNMLTPPSHVHALFRNRELQFMMTNLERPPSGAFQIRFDVHGGFSPQTVAIPTTVEVTMPTRLVVGPFDASNPVAGVPGAMTHEVPYLFVVDQRRLGRAQGGGPTRGQLLRIHPRGFAITSPVTGAQPWYEDLNHSANLFPIQ